MLVLCELSLVLPIYDPRFHAATQVGQQCLLACRIASGPCSHVCAAVRCWLFHLGQLVENLLRDLLLLRCLRRRDRLVAWWVSSRTSCRVKVVLEAKDIAQGSVRVVYYLKYVLKLSANPIMLMLARRASSRCHARFPLHVYSALAFCAWRRLRLICLKLLVGVCTRRACGKCPMSHFCCFR